MKTSVWVAPVASVVVLFGAVGVANLTGDWVVSGRTTFVTGEQLGVDDLKGWMTLQQAADGLGIPVGEIIDLIDPSGTAGLTPETPFRDVETLVEGFELGTFKEQLRAHLAGAAVSPSATATTSATPSPQPTGTGSGAGQPAITGQMTLAAVAQAYGVDLAELVAACGLPADVDTRATLRTLKDTYPSFEIQQVRDAVAELA